METSDRFPFGAAAYLTNRYNLGAWPVSYPKFTEKEIGQFLPQVLLADHMARLRQTSDLDTKGIEPFLTAEDIEAVVEVALTGAISIDEMIIGHPFMSEKSTLRTIQMLIEDKEIAPALRRSMLSGAHRKDNTTDRIIAAVYTSDPRTPWLLSNPKAGPETVNAWLANPYRRKNLAPEEVINLLNQDGIPDRDYRALCHSLEQFGNERLARIANFWQQDLTGHIGNILNPDFRHAHLIKDSLRSRLVIALTLS